jgi:hypothetical protein
MARIIYEELSAWAVDLAILGLVVLFVAGIAVTIATA